MRNEPIDRSHQIEASVIDLPIADSVALSRLIAEVEHRGELSPLDTTLYNRTYHRHNR